MFVSKVNLEWKAESLKTRHFTQVLDHISKLKLEKGNWFCGSLVSIGLNSWLTKINVLLVLWRTHY